MALYPVFLKLEGRKVLVVGGGAVAEQKLQGVLRSATDVTVVAPELTPRIRDWQRQGLLKYIPQEFCPGMAQGYFLVIAATDSPEVNHAVYAEAKSSGALCNAVDDTPYCDFYAAALVARGDFQIAISTGGNSPALAQRVRKKLEAEYGPEYESWNRWLGRMRSALRSVLPPGEHRKQLLHLLALTKPSKTLLNDTREEPMDSTRRAELELRLRATLKEHQQEGLHQIGGTDEGIARLLNTIDEWQQGLPLQARKSA